MTAELENRIDLLGTLHYVFGVLTALTFSIPIIHLVIGIVMLMGTINGGDAAPRAVALAFIIIPLIVIIIGWVLAALIIASGYLMRARRSYTFCLTISFLECLLVPLGSILGVFTILALSKEGAAKLFEQPAALEVSDIESESELELEQDYGEDSALEGIARQEDSGPGERASGGEQTWDSGREEFQQEKAEQE